MNIALAALTVCLTFGRAAELKLAPEGARVDPLPSLALTFSVLDASDPAVQARVGGTAAFAYSEAVRLGQGDAAQAVLGRFVEPALKASIETRSPDREGSPERMAVLADEARGKLTVGEKTRLSERMQEISRMLQPRPEAEAAVTAGPQSLLARLLPGFKRTPPPPKTNELFVERHGAALRAVAGVRKVEARTIIEGAGGYAWKVNAVLIDVDPAADPKKIQAMLEGYRYAGAELRVSSNGWELYEINDRGGFTSSHALDPKMAASLKEYRGDQAREFVARHAGKIHAVAGVLAVKDGIVDGPYTYRGVTVEVAPTADFETIRKALEPYRYAGVWVMVKSRGWEVYEITRDGKSYVKNALDPRMALSGK